MKRSAITLLLLAVCGQLAAAEPPRPSLPVEVFFSPKGGCTEAIIKELKNAKDSVLVQAYWFTSPSIAKALVQAHKRGVKVEVILDQSRTDMEDEQAKFIAKMAYRPSPTTSTPPPTARSSSSTAMWSSRGASTSRINPRTRTPRTC